MSTHELARLAEVGVLVEPGNDHAARHYPVTTRMQLGQCGIQVVADRLF
jgi:hypothetical protein